MTATTADPTPAPSSDQRPLPTQASRRVGWIYAIGGSIGFAAAFVLLLERLHLLEDPTYIPTCSINQRLDCGAVMSSDQADAFGFPNPILGVAGFPIIVTVGAALLAGATLARWYRIATATGVAAAVVFVHWLIVQSVLRIGALCPYCMIVWMVTIAIAWYTLLDLAQDARPRTGRGRSLTTAALTNHTTGLACWYLAIAAFVAVGL